MARLNDNLFTTLVECAMPGEIGSFLQTRLGCLRIRFTGAGLAELVFVDDRMDRSVDAAGAASLSGSDIATSREWRREGVFRGALLEWVRYYQELSAAAKWSYLDLEGTDFQRSVWRQLLESPFGGCTSYGQIAVELGQPKASRAVGSAVGANPLALLVPCHRVLPSTGQSGNYRWGADRKRALLDVEQESGSDLSSLFQ